MLILDLLYNYYIVSSFFKRSKIQFHFLQKKIDIDFHSFICRNLKYRMIEIFFFECLKDESMNFKIEFCVDTYL